MTAVRLWREIWQQGQSADIPDNIRETYGSARFPGMGVKCLKVMPGFRVRLHGGKDGTGYVSDAWFEAGDYHDLSFYKRGPKNAILSPDDWMIEVEPVTYPPESLVVCYDENAPWQSGGEYGPRWKFPPAEHKSIPGSSRISSVIVPPFHRLTLYDQKDCKGHSIELEGSETYDLTAYGWSNKAKSLALRPDDMEIEKITYEELSSDVLSTVAGSMVSHNTSGVTITPAIEVNGEVSDEQSWDWNVEAGVSLMVGTEGGAAPFGIGATVKTELTVSMSAGYGQSGSSSESKGWSASTSAEIPPGQSVKFVLLVDVQTVKYRVTRVWKSLRTGKTVTDTSIVESSYGIAARCDAMEPQVGE